MDISRILKDEHKREQEMKLYNIKHNLEKNKNYINRVNTVSKNEKHELGKYIYNNYDKMDEIEMKLFVLKCMDINEIKRTLLLYELKNYQHKSPKNTKTLNEFKYDALKVLKRYHWKAGGFFVEDSDWIIHNTTSTNHEIRENELLFENTISRCDVDDDETDMYLQLLVDRLNLIAKNITVEIRMKVDEYMKSCSLLLWATDEDNISSAVVGL
jgi:hypothetical protein